MTKLNKSKRRGMLLASDSDDAILYTHFDCWPGGEDSEYTVEENQEANTFPTWRTPATVALMKGLCDEWSQHTGIDFSLVRNLIPAVDLVTLFEIASLIFVDNGYAVYNSDTMFEVYAITKDNRAEFEEEEPKELIRIALKLVKVIDEQRRRMDEMDNVIDDACGFAECFVKDDDEMRERVEWWQSVMN